MIQAALYRYFARHMGTRHAIIFPRARPPQRDLVTLGIVNRTFENRTQSTDWGRQSNTELCVNSISEPIEPNRTQSILLFSSGL